MHLVQENKERDGPFRIVVDSFPREGGMLAASEFTATAGHVYFLKLKLSAKHRTNVSIGLRERKLPYRTGAIAQLVVGKERQEINLVGGFGFDVEALLYIQLQEAGKIWIHEATLRKITENEINDQSMFPAANGIFESHAFGMHINKLGRHNTWPDIDIGLVRLWDTGTTWADLEPEKNALNAQSWGERGQPGARLKYYLRHIDKYSPQASVMLTLAATPSWAASNERRNYYTGSSSPPRDLTDWRSFLRGLVGEVGNQIKYYELWNEVDINYQYSGDSATLVSMAKIMAEELSHKNSLGQVSSPNITTYGTPMLARFLSDGGGSYIDYISWHHYPSPRPENSVPAILGVRDVMRRYGVDALPLFNTEGRIGGDQPGAWASEIPDRMKPALLARAYLVQFAYGVSSFSWFMWDDNPSVSSVILNGTGPPAYTGTSSSGSALRVLIGWVKGRQIVTRTIKNLGTDREIWQLDLETSSQKRSSILWTVERSEQIALPNTLGYSSIQKLDGTVLPLKGNDLTVGTAPILVY